MTPTPIEIKSVNRNTSKNIISALLSSNGITRGELAKRCGVSAMTVGKVVNVLHKADYASIASDITKSGRLSEFIYPSKRFRFLIFTIDTATLRANLYDARENTLLSYTQPRNPSFEPQTEIESFISFVYEELEPINASDNAFLLSALIYDGDCIKALGSLTLDKISLRTDNRRAILEYVKSAHPNGSVAFVCANKAHISLISNGEAVNSKSAPTAKDTCTAHSEQSLLDMLSLRLTNLFAVIIPDKIIIDSASLSLSRRFANELEERLCESARLKKEELPELITNNGISFPSRAVIGQLISIYSELIIAN